MKEIHKHPLKWLYFEHGEYAELIYTQTLEELGRILTDLVEMCLKKSHEPAYPINDRTLAHSYAMWDEHVNKGRRNSAEGKAAYRKLKDENKALKGEGGGEGKPEPEMFRLETNEYPTREEAAAYAASFGGKLGGEYHDWSTEHNWIDKNGKKIYNWKRACLAYENNHNPDFKQKEGGQ